MNLNQLLVSVPKAIIAITLIAVGIILIVANDPPHTFCRTQIDNFKATQSGVLYKNSNIKTRTEPLLRILINTCKEYSAPGSCYGLFLRMKVFIQDFKLVSVDCRQEFSTLSKVRKILFEVYSLMIRLAWGDAPPKHYDKLAWLSDVDMSLFCLLKENILFFYGKEALLRVEQKVFKILPGAENMDEDSIREMALVSENCSRYPFL